jgi:hypothetical protein
MSTEVVHGPNPQFRVPLAPGGPYRMTIEGYYATIDGLTAAGVTACEWVSERPAKRQAELLGLRTAFIDWFLLQWVACGGTFDDGVRQIQAYPFELHRRIAGGA